MISATSGPSCGPLDARCGLAGQPRRGVLDSRQSFSGRMGLLLATSSRVKGTHVPLTRGEPAPSLTGDGTEWRPTARIEGGRSRLEHVRRLVSPSRPAPRSYHSGPESPAGDPYRSVRP